MKRLSRTIFWGVSLAVTVAATLVNWPAIDKLPGKTSLDEFIRIPNETISGAMQYFPALAKAYREGHQEVRKQVQELLRQGKIESAKRKADQEMGESVRLARLAAEKTYLGRWKGESRTDLDADTYYHQSAAIDLFLYAKAEAGLGRRADAVRDFWSALSLLQLCKERIAFEDLPSLIELESNCWLGLGDAAALAPHDSAYLDSLTALLQEFPNTHDLRFLVGAKHALALETTTDASVQPGEVQIEMGLRAHHFSQMLVTVSPSKSATQVAARQKAFQEFWRVAAKLLEQDKTDWPRLERDWRQALLRCTAKYGSDSVRGLSLVAGLHGLGDLPLRLQASKLVTRAVIESLKFQEREGRQPTSLSELEGDWTDPFSGKPLRWMAKSVGVVVYSVGPNRVDNEGSEDSDDLAGRIAI